MTNADYHKHSAVSKSDLDLINHSPLHYITAKQNQREQTETQLLGSVIHKLVLEPETFASEYVTAPECNKRTKNGKATWQEFADGIENETVISAELFEKAKAVSESVLNHELAKKLLSGGQAEQSFFWTENGIECKCRPDYLKNKIVIDLKTAQDASPDAFSKSVYNYRYYVQAWWYLHGLQKCGIDVTDFVFIAVEKEPPYAVCIYAADDLILELGEREAMKNLKVYAECLNSGIWHGYDKQPNIHSLTLPDWVIRKEF